MTELQIVAEAGVPQIIITREFAAPRDLLFRVYTDPELLARWLGPARLTLTVNQLDARHGGRWRTRRQDPAAPEYCLPVGRGPRRVRRGRDGEVRARVDGESRRTSHPAG